MSSITIIRYLLLVLQAKTRVFRGVRDPEMPDEESRRAPKEWGTFRWDLALPMTSLPTAAWLRPMSQGAVQLRSVDEKVRIGSYAIQRDGFWREIWTRGMNGHTYHDFRSNRREMSLEVGPDVTYNDQGTELGSVTVVFEGKEKIYQGSTKRIECLRFRTAGPARSRTPRSPIKHITLREFHTYECTQVNSRICFGHRVLVNPASSSSSHPAPHSWTCRNLALWRTWPQMTRYWSRESSRPATSLQTR